MQELMKQYGTSGLPLDQVRKLELTLHAAGHYRIGENRNQCTKLLTLLVESVTESEECKYELMTVLLSILGYLIHSKNIAALLSQTQYHALRNRILHLLQERGRKPANAPLPDPELIALTCGIWWLRESSLESFSEPGSETNIRDFLSTIHIVLKKRAGICAFHCECLYFLASLSSHSAAVLRSAGELWVGILVTAMCDRDRSGEYQNTYKAVLPHLLPLLTRPCRRVTNTVQEILDEVTHLGFNVRIGFLKKEGNSYFRTTSNNISELVRCFRVL